MNHMDESIAIFMIEKRTKGTKGRGILIITINYIAKCDIQLGGNFFKVKALLFESM